MAVPIRSRATEPRAIQRPIRMHNLRARTKRLAALAAVCTASVLLLDQQDFGPAPELEFYTLDLRARLGRPALPEPELVFLAIDQASYHDWLSPDEIASSPMLAELARTFPWSRIVWAELIEKLCRAGAKVVAIDLLFAAPGQGDPQLQTALERYRNRVVIASNFASQQTASGTTINLTLPDETILPPSASPLSAAQDERVGFVNLWPDDDGVVRRARFRVNTAQFLNPTGADVAGASARETSESLAARVLRQLGRADAVPPGFDQYLFRYTAPPGLGYRARSVAEIFVPKLWENNFQSGRFFQDKVVVVGPAANFFHDEHPTPFQRPQRNMLGPELHLNILNAALRGEFLRETTRFRDGLATAAAGLLAWIAFVLFHQARKRFPVILGLSLGYLVVAQLAYDRANLVLAVAGPLVAFLTCCVACLGYDFVHERLEKARVRRALERYVSRNVVRELLDHPQAYFDALGGVRKPVTILFADLRGFTALSEGMDSAALVQQLNEYFDAMVEHVLEGEGTLDKFIGDAIMAVWGNMRSRGAAPDAVLAVETVLRMRASLAQLNPAWRAAGRPELGFGLGLNHGEAIVGNIGYRGKSGERMEFTVIGDAVNLASRLEGLTKEYQTDLLLSESVAALVRDRFVLRTVDMVTVKGKTKPVEVFTVVARRESPLSPETIPGLAAYEAGILAWRQRDFARARALFQQTLAGLPEDFLARLYLARSEELLAHPPDHTWNGVFVMRSK